jgi:hypothetical protein
VDVFMRDMDTF